MGGGWEAPAVTPRPCPCPRCLLLPAPPNAGLAVCHQEVLLLPKIFLNPHLSGPSGGLWGVGTQQGEGPAL